jgi:hypothetical protein
MKNLLYIIILILAIISLTFAYQYYKNKKIIKEDKIIKNNMENKINALEKHIYFNNQFNNFKLNKNLEFFSVKKTIKYY